MTAHTTDKALDAVRAAMRALCRDLLLVDRLQLAYESLASVDPARELPPALRFRYEELVADIAYGADTVADALSRMSTQDLEHLAGRVLSMYADVLRTVAPER